MATKFDFLSPGVNIREIDQSILPAQAQEPGPVLIGRARKGPAMQPILINTYEDFVDVFGAPILGSAGINNDAWRNGNMAGPQYAGLAAQAHLASQTSPVTFVRLLGDDNPNVPIDSGIKPGYTLAGSPSSNPASNSTAYGLFLVDSGSVTANKTGALAAVFYVDSGYIALSGTLAGDGGTVTSSAGSLIKSQGVSKEFKIAIYNSSNSKTDEISFSFDSSDNSKYIRSQFNTNPILINSDLVDADNRKTYWLGETFDRFVADSLSAGTAAGDTYGILLALESGSVNWSDHDEGHKYAQSGWVIAQDQGAAGDFDPATSNTKLFRFVSLHGGDSLQKETMIGISNITLPIDSAVNAFASFNIEIMDLAGNILEEHRGVNLNPQSSEYIVARMGDTKFTWLESERRYQTDGTEPNISNFFRVEVSNTVRDGAAQGLAPFGFLGPVRPKGFSLVHLSKGPNTFGDVVNSGTKAAATITTVAEASLVDTKDFILTDADGIATRYNISTGLATTDNTLAYTPGGEDGRGPAGTITIGMLGTTSRTDVRDQIIARINAGTNIGFTAAASGDDVEVTQNVIGTVGNKTNSEPDGSTGLTIGNFTGGADDTDDFAGAFVKANDDIPAFGGDANTFVNVPTDYTASFRFPKMALRGAGSEGNPVDEFEVYYGIRPRLSATSTQVDNGYSDYTLRLAKGVDNYTPDGEYEHSFVFSLDDLVVNSNTRDVTYTAGSRAAGTSRTATSGAANLLDLDIQQFVMPIWGGFDGLDITEKEPFRNKDVLNSATYTSTTNNAPLYSVFKAIDSVRDNEQVIANTISIPGVWADRVADKLISTAETRKDLLAVIDVEGGYVPSTEQSTRAVGSVSSVISEVKSRKFNSSYGCVFYPWVQINANTGVESGKLWAPPSVAAIGAFAKSTAQSELWFAPAGFSRGGKSSRWSWWTICCKC